jgi:hypothetical protein
MLDAAANEEGTVSLGLRTAYFTSDKANSGAPPYSIKVRTAVESNAPKTLLCIAAAIAVSFIFTFPANQVTTNWTNAPDYWLECGASGYIPTPQARRFI